MKEDLMILSKYNPEKIKQAFAKSLKKLRLYVGFSLLDLERLTNINNPSLSRYENGKVEPSLSQAIIIAETFQLKVEDFILYGLEEKSDGNTIEDCFNQNIANLIFEMGENAEDLLQQIYPHICIEDIKKEYT